MKYIQTQSQSHKKVQVYDMKKKVTCFIKIIFCQHMKVLDKFSMYVFVLRNTGMKRKNARKEVL